MSKKKRPAPIVGEQKDKLIIALQIDELVGTINRALRVRKASFEIDYTEGPHPKLYLARPGIEREAIMTLDPRKHLCYSMPPKNRELFVIYADLTESLFKLGARLFLSGEKTRTGAKRCALQIQVTGARRIALTLMDTTRGHRKIDTAFQLPDGTTP